MDVDQYVDLYTGDLNYKIPLFDLQGPNGNYPFVLTYSSNITMDQEASWVGLGWSLSAGAISRQMRGLADDWNGARVRKVRDVKPNYTWGVSAGGSLELIGADNKKGGKLSGSAGITAYYNNYKGWGQSRDIGFGYKNVGGTSLTAGLGLKLDTQGGLTLSPSLGLGWSLERKESEFQVGASASAAFNSRQGLSSLSLGYSGKVVKTKPTGDQGKRSPTDIMGLAGQSTLSFARSAYVPYYEMPMTGWNVSATFKLGGEFLGVHPNLYIRGFYNRQWLKNRAKVTAKSAFGYLHLEGFGTSETSGRIMDINREHDGMIRKESPNLPIPSLTHDIYTVTGTGMSGAFRPYRREIGVVYDPEVKSSITGGGLGVEIGGGNAVHVGIDGSLNHSVSESKPWLDPTLSEIYKFKGAMGESAQFKPYYFRFLGEHTAQDTSVLSHVGGERAVRAELATSGLSEIVDEAVDLDFELFSPTGQLTDAYGIATPAAQTESDAAEPRSRLIQSFSNADLIDADAFTNQHLHVTFYDVNEDAHVLERSGRDHDDIAAFVITGTDGVRYIYALPVYNNEHVEYVFSVEATGHECEPTYPLSQLGGSPGSEYYKVSNSEEYYRRTELPPYVYSYLLTAIVGPDYVDADNIPGASAGDFGHWVKFTYTKWEEDYKWRAPFVDANFNPGMQTPRDDKASFMYGSRQVYCLRTAETKTQIAQFFVSERRDARGAVDSMQTANSSSCLGASLFQLDKVSLFSRNSRLIHSSEDEVNELPLKTVHFRYRNELCRELPNGQPSSGYTQVDDTVSGKLTLKRLWFTHERSTRGSLSPYVFDYDYADPDRNPRYESHHQDAWGSYKPCLDNYKCWQMDVASPHQIDGSGSFDLGALNAHATAWRLRAIHLPSGGSLHIDYESDTYSHVQNKPATYMARIIDPDGNGKIGSFEDWQVVFPLVQPISKSTSQEALAELLQRYARKHEQVYFKAHMYLKDHSQSISDIVAGFARVDNVDVLDAPGPGPYTHGVITVRSDNGKRDHHPITEAALQHLLLNRPEDIYTPLSFDPDAGWDDHALMIPSLVGYALSEIVSAIDGYYDNATRKGWGQEFDQDRSWIRLRYPYGRKFGGGCRVSRLTLVDNWGAATDSSEPSSEYGFAYLYDNEDGSSSGVTTFEPMVMHEENPLRMAKTYTQSVPLGSDYNLFFPYPINTGYMPGPMVGYQKVRVRSLATQGVVDGRIPASVRTTGETRHRFFTSRDFPVQTEETAIQKKFFDLWVPLLFFGEITIHNMTASQGYAITLNDMAGKLKELSHFGVDTSGQVETNATSWTRYNYNARPIRLKNNVVMYQVEDALNVFDSIGPSSEKRVGLDYEFFLDMRHSRSEAIQGGVNLNLDFGMAGPIPIVLVGPFANIGWSLNQMQTVVANKIIHKAGVLTGVESFDGQTLSRTDYHAFDAITGQPLLTSRSNRFGDPVYSLTIPAHWPYAGMGNPNRKIDLRFEADLGPCNGEGEYCFDPPAGLDLLGTGDELMVRGQDASARATVVQDGDILKVVSGSGEAPTGRVTIIMLRPAERNMLSANAGVIEALENPEVALRQGRQDICRETIYYMCDSCEVSHWVPFVTPCAHAVVRLLDSLCRTEAGGRRDLRRTLVNDPLVSINELCGRQIQDIPWEYCVPYNRSTLSDTAVHLFVRGDELEKCGVTFLSASGDPIAIRSIVSVSNPTYLEQHPAKIQCDNRTGYDFANISVDIWQKGQYKPAIAYLFSSCGFWTAECLSTEWVYQECRWDTSYVLQLFDKVLNMSATTYNQSWLHDMANVRFPGSAEYAEETWNRLLGLHPYYRGDLGIWRPAASYEFLEERKQSFSDPNLRVDGTVDNAVMFQWNNAAFLDCAPQWLRVDTTTQYSPCNFAIESRDILDIPSSALFGHNNSLLTALAVDAESEEILSESFEEYYAGDSVTPWTTSGGNFDFCTKSVWVFNWPRDLVWSGRLEDRRFGVIDQPVLMTADRSVEVFFPEGYGMASSTQSGMYSVRVHGTIDDGASVLMFEDIDAPLHPSVPIDVRTPVADQVHYVVEPVRHSKTRSAITKRYAHTGVRSLLIGDTISFEQNRLQLKPDKAYVLTAWMRKADDDVHTYKTDHSDSEHNPGIRIRYLDGSDHELSVTGPLAEPSGPIIEGWQRVEAIFVMPDDAAGIVLQFQPGVPKPAAYFDDIRLMPFASNLECYVYDVDNLRLVAKLDRNHFATFFDYAEDGSLYLVRKETVQGIQSVQESRFHLRERAAEQDAGGM
ncbi:MAG: hypothetical protein ABII79_09340 [bacterium]